MNSVSRAPLTHARSILALLLCFLPVTFVAGQPTTTSHLELNDKITEYLEADEYSNATWALKIIDLSTGNVWFEQNAGKSMMPASNAKLYTTAAALDLLGPDFRYETGIYTDGELQDGVLRGNLIIRGSGDPSIGDRYVDGEPEAIFRKWAEAFSRLGIRRIEGDIVGDDDLFDDLSLGYGWSWDDEPYYYSAEISPLTFYDNSVRFILEGQQLDMPGKLRWEPFNTSYVDVVNHTRTISPQADDDIDYKRDRNFNTIEAIGEIYPTDIDTSYITVSNPTKYFTHVLRYVLVQEGIAVTGRPVDVDDLSFKPDYSNGSLDQLLVHRSPALSELVVILNKESQNLYAELLMRTIGIHRPVEQGEDDDPYSSAEMGIASAMETYARARMDTSRLNLYDGSGLSRMNLVTAEMTARLLTYMWNHKDANVRNAYYNSLPIGGIDGTLEDRFRRGPAFRNVRAKTGTLTGVSSLSGYVSTADGTPLLFVMMCNNYTMKTSIVRRTQNAIVTLLSRHVN